MPCLNPAPRAATGDSAATRPPLRRLGCAAGDSGWGVARALGAAAALIVALVPGAAAAVPPAAPLADSGASPTPRTAAAVEAPAAATASALADEQLASTKGLSQAEQRCQGRPIAVTELLDCVSTRCQERSERQKFLSLTDLRPGATLEAGMLLRAVRRLVETGFFRVADVGCTAAPTGARIRIRVVGNTVIRRIGFDGNKELFTSELRNKLLFQPGDVLNPDTDSGREQLARQVAAYETLYQRAGFEKAKVRIAVEPYGVGQISLRVAVQEGGRDRVAGVEAFILDPHRPNDKERSAGLRCPRVRERALLQVSGLPDIDVFTRRTGVKARSKVREHLRRLGYHNPRVSIEHDRRDGLVRVEVRLGRCSLVRVLMRESAEQISRDAAYTQSDDEALLSALPFVESGVFDLSEAERGRRELRAALENRGYLFADVELEYREAPRSWGSRIASAITYRITTQYLAQIRGLHFCDVDRAYAADQAGGGAGCAQAAGAGLAFSASELLGAIQTRPYDVLDEGGFLSTAQMFGDLDALRNFYRDAGYFEFRFPLAASPGAQGIVRQRRRTGSEEIVEYLLPDRGFRVRRPIGEHFIYVDVPFDEGRRSRYGRVDVQGAAPARLARVRELLAAKPGGIASATRLLQGLRQVEDDYHNLGYFQVKVAPFCQTRGRAVVADAAAGLRPCTAERILAETVDLEVRISEGPRVRIGEVFVAGNFRTPSALLLRDMPPTGTDFSAQRLFDALRALRDRGLFRSVAFQYIGRDESPSREEIAIIIRVVEDDTLHGEASFGFQTVNVNRVSTSGLPGVVDIIEHITSTGGRLGTGYGQRLGVNLPNLLFTVDGKVVERNLDVFDGGKELHLEGRIGFTPDLSAGPALLLAALVYQDRRLLGSDVSLRLFPAYLSRDFATTTIDLDKAGSAADVAKSFGKLGLSLGLDAGIVRFRDNVAANAHEPLSDWQAQYKVLSRASFDGLDSPLNPTTGVFATVSASLVNVLTENIVDKRSERGTFVKVDAQLKGLLTLRETLTLATMVRAGWAIGFDEAAGGRLPANERYRLGGQLGLRGYLDNGILQYGADGAPLAQCTGLADDGSCSEETVIDSGNIVLHGTIEARFPLLRSRGLWSALFWDWGGIGEGWGALHSASIRHSVGAGLRLLVSDQIPIRLDYGVALDRRCATLAGQGKPCTREPFGQLHVGLLYSF